MQTELSSLDFQVLSVLDRSAPVGARTLAQALEELGISVSEATAARLLTRCDTRGFSYKSGKRGRALTAEGKQRLEDAKFRLKAGEQLSDALDIRSAMQLLDLLHLRRATETEAAMLAARRASDADLAKLRECVEEHLSWAQNPTPPLPGISFRFHHLVIEASHSPLIISIYSMIEPRIKALAPALSVIAGVDGEPSEEHLEHAAILDALQRRDPEAAAATMAHHLGGFIAEVTHFVELNDPKVVARLLAIEQRSIESAVE